MVILMCFSSLVSEGDKMCYSFESQSCNSKMKIVSIYKCMVYLFHLVIYNLSCTKGINNQSTVRWIVFCQWSFPLDPSSIRSDISIRPGISYLSFASGRVYVMS